MASKYVKATLEFGQGEQRARFGEMSEGEKRQFVKLWLKQARKAGLNDPKQELLWAVPAAEPFL